MDTNHPANGCFDFDEYSGGNMLPEPQPYPYSSSNHYHSSLSMPIVGTKRKAESVTYRKAPQAPKHFKSPYVCFATAHQRQVKEQLGPKWKLADVNNKLIEMWRSLSVNERKVWDDAAEKDKERYMREKEAYAGPWKVPSKKKKKHPDAPKRPMSAFLYFSQNLRREIKRANPHLKNTDVSRILGEKWRNTSTEERRKYVEKESEEREKYKLAMIEFNEKQREKMEAADTNSNSSDEEERFTPEPIEPPTSATAVVTAATSYLHHQTAAHPPHLQPFTSHHHSYTGINHQYIYGSKNEARLLSAGKNSSNMAPYPIQHTITKEVPAPSATASNTYHHHYHHEYDSSYAAPPKTIFGYNADRPLQVIQPLEVVQEADLDENESPIPIKTDTLSHSSPDKFEASSLWPDTNSDEKSTPLLNPPAFETKNQWMNPHNIFSVPSEDSPNYN